MTSKTKHNAEPRQRMSRETAAQCEPLFTGKMSRDTAVAPWEVAAEVSVAMFSALKKKLKK